MTISLIDGDRNLIHVAATGSGTPSDPYVPVHQPLVQIGGIIRTPSYFVSTNVAGSIEEGAVSASIVNVGTAPGTVLGATLNPRVSIQFAAPTGDTLAAIEYDATGTEFLVGEVR